MYYWALCLTAALSQNSVSQGKKEKKKKNPLSQAVTMGKEEN